MAEWSVLQGMQKQMNGQLAARVEGEIVTVETQDVYFTQNSVSPTLCNGMTLAQLTQDLHDGVYDPLETPWLVLDVMQVVARQNLHPGARCKTVYYTLDHRRLKAIKDASCPKVQVCVFLHHKFSDFVNKGMDSIGQRSDIKVRRPRYVQMHECLEGV